MAAVELPLDFPTATLNAGFGKKSSVVDGGEGTQVRDGSSPSRSDSPGSGWGGTRTPADDFADSRRRIAWNQDFSKSLPPRVYVDNKTLIREVHDLCTLRRGDHCVIAINLVRALSPALDYAISWLGSIEVCYFYHHFLLVDDVSFVDEVGIPRTKDGKMAMIFEWGNTVPEAYTEVKTKMSGRFYALPAIAVQFLLHYKAKFTAHPLADYGDTPHIYLVLAKQTAEEREKTIVEAMRLHNDKHKKYNVLFNNCEHACNMLRKGSRSSAQVSFACWVVFRVLLGTFGLAVLRMQQEWMLFAECVLPTVAVSAYYLFAITPVALQALITYLLIMRSVHSQHVQELIDRDEYWHLVWKEFGRAVIVNGWTIVAIYFAPRIASTFMMRFLVCAFSYVLADVVYNCLAHAVMRLVLLPAYGRVWLLGPRRKSN